MNIFEEGSPVQRFLNKMADLLILNIITLLMCLPIITAGAALTAMHYVLLKIVRGEEGYILRSFFRSFKRDFIQGTARWLIFLAIWGLMGSNLYMIVQGSGRYPIYTRERKRLRRMKNVSLDLRTISPRRAKDTKLYRRLRSILQKQRIYL